METPRVPHEDWTDDEWLAVLRVIPPDADFGIGEQAVAEMRGGAKEIEVIFRKKGTTLTCKCGEFEIDLLLPPQETQEKIWAHAKSHSSTPGIISVMIDESFDVF